MLLSWESSLRPVCSRYFSLLRMPLQYPAVLFLYYQASLHSLIHLHCSWVDFSSPICDLLKRSFSAPNMCASSCAVVDLVYWRNVRRTGVVFTGLVISLASVFQLSAITVLSHICLGALCVTFTLRLYYKLLELLRWNPGIHPFQWVNVDLVVSFSNFKSTLNAACTTLCGLKHSWVWLIVRPQLLCVTSAALCVLKGLRVCLCPQVVSGQRQLSDR